MLPTPAWEAGRGRGALGSANNIAAPLKGSGRGCGCGGPGPPARPRREARPARPPGGLIAGTNPGRAM